MLELKSFMLGVSVYTRGLSLVVGIIFLFVISLTTTSYANANQDNTTKNREIEDNKLNVVTSVAPITNIFQNIGGEKIKLNGLVSEGVDSPTFELIPSDLIKINNADLIIINGLNLEANMQKIAENAIAKNSSIQFLKLGDNTISQDQWVFDFSFPKEKGDPNPHLWLNVQYAMKFANLTRDKLIEMDPSNAQYYIDNSKKYNELLKQLDNGIRKSIETIPVENRKLLTYHDSWAYFAPRYGMNVIGAIQSSDFNDPSPRYIANQIDQVSIEKVPAIFASEVFPTNIVDQIA